MTLVSIVTPSLNQGRFLRRTIESVLAQDYPKIEYFVIDGGSCDSSVEILRSFGESFSWVSEPDEGQCAAINKGLTRAQGDIYAYLNSDDVLLPGAISAVVETFRQHPDWDLVYGDAWHINADDRILEKYPTAPYSFDRLQIDCCICQPATFWRRSLAERVGPFDETLHFAMDYDYWMRADRAGGRLVHVPEFWASSRLHPDTKTQSRRLDVYREILATCLRHAGTPSFSQTLAYWHHRCHERPGDWTQHLSRIPDSPYWLALMQTRWQKNQGRVVPFAWDLIRSAARIIA